jgi:excisionase family DNA binding protein
MIKSPGLLHVHHVAEILACSPRHVRNLVKAGELQAVRIGTRDYRIFRDSVMRFLENGRVQTEKFYE